jgi:hypothetical protein
MSRGLQWFWITYLCVVMWIVWVILVYPVSPQIPPGPVYVEYVFPESQECQILKEAEIMRIQNNNAKIYFEEW